MPAIADAPSDSLTYYTAQIRAEIAAEVRKLKRELPRQWIGEWRATEPIHAEYVRLGYIINSHHGLDLFKEGELLEGLPVRIDRCLGRTIAVHADGVEGREEYEEMDETGDDWVTRYRYSTEDLEAAVTW